ncbi:MAG: hypothetical protein QM831_12810 [Kofleriaceae bacterium]
MAQHDHDAKAAGSAELSTPVAKKPDGMLDRFEAMLAHAAPPAIGHYLRVLQASPPMFERAYAMLQSVRGNNVAKQAIAHMAARSSDGKTNATLSGSMLISNNPEAIMTGGKVVEQDVPAGPVAVYAHHSNISGKPLNVSMVVRPQHGGEHMNRDGAHASQGDSHHTPGSSSEQWSHDPNVFVSTVAEAKKGEAAYGLGEHTRGEALGKVKVVPLGTISPVPHGKEPKLFDARYHLDLDGPATIAIVAEEAQGGQSPADDKRMATGNMKYQELLTDPKTGKHHMTNGRASGLYTGAMFSEHETIGLTGAAVRKPLTGSSTLDNQLSPQADKPQLVGALQSQTVDAVRAQLAKGDIDHAVVILLEQQFRIATAWLKDKGVWDGTKLNPISAANSAMYDYQTLITDLQVALRIDQHAAELAATRDAIRKHSHIGATADGASYGTKFDVWYTLHNETPGNLGLEIDFVTDTQKPAPNGHHNPWRGTVRVDGHNHVIESDGTNGYKAATELEDVTLTPDERKAVHVEFMSPGQASAGQAIDIKPKK